MQALRCLRDIIKDKSFTTLLGTLDDDRAGWLNVDDDREIHMLKSVDSVLAYEKV